MSITTCQKVTLISCSVLCVSLFLPRMLLPRAKEAAVQSEVGPGFYPPMKHRAPLSPDSEQWGLDSLEAVTHHTETVLKIKGVTRKNNLMAQVIPIYGFGILLYILYIIYKLTVKETPTKPDCSFTTYKTDLDYTQLNEQELAKLQRRLLQTEQMMEMIVSGKSRGIGSGRSRKSKQSKREEKLLRHLRQISELMQEGRLEGESPEMEAEEVPYFAGWEGYPEETYPEYEEDLRKKKHCKLVPLVVTLSQPTAEALAERMEQEEEDLGPRKLEVLHEEDEEEVDEEVDEGQEEYNEDEGEEEIENATTREEDEDEVLMTEEEEEEDERTCLLNPSPLLTSNKKEFLGLECTELRSHSPGKKITFSDHHSVYRYPREDEMDKGHEEEKREMQLGEEEVEEEQDEEEEESEVEEEMPDEEKDPEAEEEDPVMEAESLQFSSDAETNPEREAEEETEGELTGIEEVPAERHVPEPSEHWAVSGLRMRNRRDT